MKYRTYTPYTGRGAKKRPTDRTAREKRAERLEIKLIICLSAAAVFSISSLLFPAFFGEIRQTVGNAIGINADFKSAASVVGEAIRGETEASEALSAACSYIFRGSAGEEANALTEPETAYGGEETGNQL